MSSESTQILILLELAYNGIHSGFPPSSIDRLNEFPESIIFRAASAAQIFLDKDKIFCESIKNPLTDVNISVISMFILYKIRFERASMNTNFAEKLNKLAEIVEKRDVSGSKNDSTPTKFSFVLLDGELKCSWTPTLAPRELSHVLFNVSIPKNGFTSEEWTSLTERLFDYL